MATGPCTPCSTQQCTKGSCGQEQQDALHSQIETQLNILLAAKGLNCKWVKMVLELNFLPPSLNQSPKKNRLLELNSSSVEREELHLGSFSRLPKCHWPDILMGGP